MIFTFFPPLAPLPDQALDSSAYAAAHCRQTRPGEVVRCEDWAAVYEWICLAEQLGRKGDAGYIIAGECTTTRKEGGPAPFCLIDYDDAAPDWAVLDAYEGFAWTTASHTPEKPAWRVLIPFVAPAAHGKLTCPFPGGHIRNRTQPAFLPTGNTIEYRDLPGTQRLDASTLGKAEVDTYQAASESLLGAVFTAAGWVTGKQDNALIVRCPWQHQHTGGKGGGTVVFHDDGEGTGLGKFSCAHGHCSKRSSSDALDALRTLPAVATELEHWPTPAALAPYTRAAEPSSSGDEPLLTDKPGEASTQLVKPAGEKAKTRFPLMTAEDMLAGDEPIPWVVEGLLSIGEPTLVVGGAGSGKTSAMVALALSVAAGRPVWGMFPVARPGPVVHIDYEQGKTLRRTYLAFAKSAGLDAAQLVRDGKLRIATLPAEQLLDANVTDAHLSAVGREILTLCTGASVCVINSLTAGTNKVNENDAKIAAVFNLLARITELTGCAFIVLHHSGKGAGGSRGSSAIDGAVQTTFQITHKRGGTSTTWEHVKDRPAGGTLDPFKLHWTNEGGAQTLSAESCPPPDAPAPGAERPEDRIAQSILFVMENRAISGKDRILECVRGKKAVKRLVWDDMLIKGMIEHVGSRFIIAAGVKAPKTEPSGGLRNEDDE